MINKTFGKAAMLFIKFQIWVFVILMIVSFLVAFLGGGK